MNLEPILLVEDNEDDAFFMRQAIRKAEILNPVVHLEDGQQAIDYLAGAGRFTDPAAHPLPLVVFLDLKLPYRSGHQVLEWIRTQPQFKKLIVIILTSSDEPVDLNRSYQLGANSFVVKPPTSEQLLELAESFKLWWLRQNRVA